MNLNWKRKRFPDMRTSRKSDLEELVCDCSTMQNKGFKIWDPLQGTTTTMNVQYTILKGIKPKFFSPFSPLLDISKENMNSNCKSIRFPDMRPSTKYDIEELACWCSTMQQKGFQIWDPLQVTTTNFTLLILRASYKETIVSHSSDFLPLWGSIFRQFICFLVG